MKYKFEDIAINSTAKKLPEPSDNEHYIGLEHLDSGNLYVTRWGADTAPIGEKLLMKKGDVLFGKRRAYQKKVGIAPFDGIFSAHGMVLRPKEDVICKEFFPFFISSDYFLNEAIRISVGGLSPTINWKDLRVLEFELPSLDEQRVLADKLWAAYEVKESYKNLLAQTEKLLHAQFEKIQNEAKEQKLSSYIDIVRGVSYKPDDICSNDESSRVILRANNISNQTLNFDDIVFVNGERVKDIQLLKMGDVLMCASSGSQEHVGKVALISEDYDNVSFGAFCLVVRGHDIIPEYLFSLLGSSSFRNHIELMCNGTSILNIRREYIEDWICPIADEHQQQEFVRVFNQAEQTKASLNKGIEAIEAVISSLIAESTTKV